jgi:hypothetical protein
MHTTIHTLAMSRGVWRMEEEGKSTGRSNTGHEAATRLSRSWDLRYSTAAMKLASTYLQPLPSALSTLWVPCYCQRKVRPRNSLPKPNVSPTS